MLQILHYSEKKFSASGIWEGVVPCPLPYTPDGLKKFRPALVLFWKIDGVTESPERA